MLWMPVGHSRSIRNHGITNEGVRGMRLSTLAKYVAQHREAFDLKVGSFNSTHDHVFGGG